MLARKKNKSGIPNASGIYLVYRGVFNKDAKPKPTVTLKQLIYIGESETVRDRIVEEHEGRECWEGKLKTGEELCYGFAPADKANRERAEAAIIFKMKPICNDQGKDSFNYQQTTIKSTGVCCRFIPKEFTVEKTT